MRRKGLRKMGTPLKRVSGSRCVGAMGVISIFAVLVLAWPSTALATVTHNFSNITGNSATNALDGENQLSVDIDNGAGTVTFTFFNIGVEEMVISEIYFDDGTLLSINSIINNPPKVVFVQDTSPAVIRSILLL